MKKLTILAVILAMAIALTACGGEKAPETTATAAPTSAVTTAPETTAAPLELTLTSWTMRTSTWSSPNGATIHINATPSYYAEGNRADFVVRLESDEVANIPCDWDGSSYTASADLNAANGYCYYIVLTAADGTVTEAAVNTPAAPVDETLIDLEAALEAYCNVTVEDSVLENGQLKLNVGKAQVKTPTITNDGQAITCQEAVLVLLFNGEALEEKPLSLTETDTAGVLEAVLDGTTFSVPEIETEQKVELTLQATLTNGQELSAPGGSWVQNDEGLLPVVG